MKPKVPHPLRDPASNLSDIIKYGYFHQLRLLICTGIDLECRDSNRRTPIILCALMEPETWGIGIARNLIENNVRVDRRDRFGRNVFHYACIYERVGLIHVLLRAADFDLNQVDKLGNTALHYAAMSGNIVVTQIIARAFKHYKIHPGKTNKRGYTATEEALRTGNAKCGHAVEQEMTERRPGSAVKDVRFADEVVDDQNIIKGQRSSFTNHHLSSFHHNNRQHVTHPRPWSTPALSRPDSSLSSISTNSFRSRSNHSYGGSNSHRKPHKTLVAMGIRHEDDVIHCADADDFRNKPDFVFKLVHLDFDPSDWRSVLTQEIPNRNTAWNEVVCRTDQSQTLMAPIDWRQDLKSLFKVYESQCSASWRAAQRDKTLSKVEQERLAAEMAEEDDKGKKPRRFSSHNKTGGSNKDSAAPELKRRLSTTRMRRRSSIHGLGHLTKMAAGAVNSSMDGSLNTSTESINSQAALGTIGGGKRRGSDREANPRPSSRSEVTATTRSGLRRPSTDSRYSSTPSPTLMLPDTNISNNNKKSSNNKNNNINNNISKSPSKLSNNLSTKLDNIQPSSSGLSNNLENMKRMPPPVSALGINSQGGSSSRQQEVPKSRGRRASLITAFLDSPNRKNDDTNVKINGHNGRELAARQTSLSGAEVNERGNNGSVTKKMAVPRVQESLVEDRRMSVVGATPSKQDTSRLWVQNPYADDEDDDDYDDNISEYDEESAIED